MIGSDVTSQTPTLYKNSDLPFHPHRREVNTGGIVGIINHGFLPKATIFRYVGASTSAEILGTEQRSLRSQRRSLQTFRIPEASRPCLFSTREIQTVCSECLPTHVHAADV